jgi:hypothetical protein
MNYLPGLASKHNPLITASQAARIIGINYWCPAKAAFFKKTKSTFRTGM